MTDVYSDCRLRDARLDTCYISAIDHLNLPRKEPVSFDFATGAPATQGRLIQDFPELDQAFHGCSSAANPSDFQPSFQPIGKYR